MTKHFPPDQVDTALRVMVIESGGDPTAHNDNPSTGDDSWGLFQVNRYGDLGKSRPLPSWLQSPENNIMFAADLYQRSGWAPWANTIKKLGMEP